MLYFVQHYLSSSKQYDTVEDKESLYRDMIECIQCEHKLSEHLNKNE